MDVDALLEAFQDFEKKAKMETCPVLEQFLCHVAKTGQPLILWPQLKQYFMFKLEKVMDDFHASTPEQRVSHNPNVEHVPFEEMKTRILKIVDGYNGVPFTIQRLCELLMDPNRNYAGTDKFLRGLEKNVRVVSSVYPMSEKNGASSVNRMNGVMFPGNSTLYSDSRNVNGPATPKPLNRTRLSLSSSLSTNGLPDGPVGKEPEPTTEEVEDHHMSDPSRSEAEDTASSGTKNKHPEEEEDSDDDKQEVKRLKFDEKEEEETEKEKKESLCLQESENLSEMPESLEVSRGQDNQSGTSCDTTCDQEPSSTGTETTEREVSSSGAGDVHTEEDESAVDEPEPPAPSEESTSFEQDNAESTSGVCDGEDPTSDKEVPSSSSSSPDLSTEGDADSSHSTDTAVEPGEQQD
ncbi:serine/threonine-protein phosphatase 4 regulatory subunit 2-A-like [Limanda limanda]|uniref:serine/threonine-protein phosphatase 4 regulatory subunit 2-A-like n=1 Tax=Limanda limanda TaxID=27771 RepID=UPI0029C6E81C|nr:serine/threonine-protein phosphatase 4 regulatory subunit 2-A-like [Limanda limanda]